MKDLTKKEKIIALIGALALLCVTCAVTMFVTGVLPSQSRGDFSYHYKCTDNNCSCHEDTSLSDNVCNECNKCRGEFEIRL